MRYLIFFSLLITSVLCAKPITPTEFDTPQERLFYFSFSGDLEGIDAALKEGADIDGLSYRPNSTSNDCFTALQVAVLQDNEPVLDHLIEKGADVHVFSKFGNANALSLATIYGRSKMVVKLLDAGADPNAAKEERYMKEYSAIAYAALYGRVDLLKLFAARGGDLERPLRWPMWRGLSPEFPLLSVAAQHGGLEVVRYLVEERGHAVNPSGKIPVLPPLSVAIRYDSMKVAEYLIAKSADVNAVGHDYYHKGLRSDYMSNMLSPLGVAARYGRHEMVKLLFANGAKIRENVKENEHPMYWADWAGYYRVIEEFEKEGYSFDKWVVIERQYRKWQGNENTERVVEGSSAYAPTFLSDFERQWESHSEIGLDAPLRLAVIADSESDELADLLTVSLSAKTHLKLVERSALEEVFKEQQLNLAGSTAGKNLGRVSRLLDAEALVLIETLQIDNKQVFQLRLVNSILGMQFGLHFVEDEAAGLARALEGYADLVGALTNTFRRNYANAIPISLVNVRSDLGTLEGLKIENALKPLLELELQAQHSVILTQRENLQTLIREKGLGGREEEFEASGIFLDLGVQLDAAGDQPESYTLRIQSASGDGLLIKLDANGKDLNESAAAICRAVVEGINLNYDASASKLKSELSIDAETYFKEALWHFNLEQYESCLKSLRTAIGLGYDKRGVWDYYFKAAENLINSHRKHFGDEANNFYVLSLERERLLALEGILKLYRSDVDKAELKAPKFGNFAPGSLDMRGFTVSFARFRPVAMQRRYAEELTSIERQFIHLINDYIIPSFAEPMPHGQFPLPNFPKDIFQAVDLMTQLDESEYEKALEGLMEACRLRAERGDGNQSEPWPNFISLEPPVAKPRWLSVCLKYLDEPETREKSAAIVGLYYRSRFNTNRLLNIPISVQKREQFADMVRQSIEKAVESESASSTPSQLCFQLDDIFGLKLVGNYAIQEGSIPLSFGRIRVRLNFDYHSKAYEIGMIESRSAAGRYSEIWPAKSIQHLQSLEFARNEFRKAAEAGKLRRWSTEGINNRIYEYESRIAELSGGLALQESVALQKLPIRLWSPELAPPSEFVATRLLHRPIADGDVWWVLVAAFRTESGEKLENPRYGLFRINPETLETQVRWLKQPVMEKYYHSPRVVRAGRWLAIARPDMKIHMIHLDTLEIRQLPGYVPTSNQVPLSFYEKHFFFFVEPDSPDAEESRKSKKSTMQILLRYDPETEESKVVYNTRRNPPETILDGTGRVFELYDINGDSVGGFLVIYDNSHGPHYWVDCETLEIRKTSRPEFTKKKGIQASVFRRSAVINDSFWIGARVISEKQNDKLPRGSISLVLRTGEYKKAVAPSPIKGDPLYSPYAEIVDVYDGYDKKYRKNDYRTPSCWFAGEYGYIDYTSASNPGGVLWGIFKTSELAEGLERSSEL